MVSPTQTVEALIDGDILAYKSAAVAEAEGWDLVSALSDAAVRISQWQRGAVADTARVCLTTGRGYRYDVFPDYKAHRKGQPVPPLLGDIRGYLSDNYDVVARDGLEADDCMGILATEPDAGVVRVIVSTDKDMQQVPGWLYNPDKARWPILVTPEQAHRYALLQWVIGDRSDGYPGIPGIGEKKAVKYLDAEGWTEESVKALYADKGVSDTERDQYRVVSRILTWDSVNHPDWSPK